MNTPGAHLTGDRRQFLVLGAATIAGAAALAACSSAPVVNSTGTIASTLTPPTAPIPTVSKEDRAADVVFLRTASSLEASLIAFYDKMLASPLVTTPAVRTWAQLFQSHHTAHLSTLGTLTTDQGGKAYTEPNASTDSSLVTSQLAAAKTEDDLVAIATTLEEIVASTAAMFVSQLAVAANRKPLTAIGGATARQVAVWRLSKPAAVRNNGLLAAFPNNSDPAFQSLRDALGVAAQVK